MDNIHLQKRAFQLFMLYQRAKGFLNSKKINAKIDQNGKSSVKFSKFIANQYKDSKYFYAFAKKDISNKKFLRLCAVAYYVKGSKFFPGELISQEVIENYITLQNYIDSFPTSFTNEYAELSRNFIDIKMLIAKGINFPLAVEMYCSNKISLGFIITLDRLTGFLDDFNDQIKNNTGVRFIWESYYSVLKKWDQLFFEDIQVDRKSNIK